MKNNPTKHMLFMASVCIVLLLILFVSSKYFDFNANYLLFGAILLCAGMHIWMMMEHKGAHNHE